MPYMRFVKTWRTTLPCGRKKILSLAKGKGQRWIRLLERKQAMRR